MLISPHVALLPITLDTPALGAVFNKFLLENLTKKQVLFDDLCILELTVVYFKLNEIWPLFAPAKAEKVSSFFNESKPLSKSSLEVSSCELTFPAYCSLVEILARRLKRTQKEITFSLPISSFVVPLCIFSPCTIQSTDTRNLFQYKTSKMLKITGLLKLKWLRMAWSEPPLI